MIFGVYLLIRKRAVLRYIFACWRFMLACWLTYVYFNVYANNVNKKMTKKSTFFAHLLPSEMPASDSQMTTSFFMLQSWMLDSRFSLVRIELKRTEVPKVS